MIIKSLIDGLFLFLNGFFELMPEISWTFDTNAIQYLKDIFDMVAYLLPFDTLVTVASLIIDFAILRLVISFVLFIKGFIPFF